MQQLLKEHSQVSIKQVARIGTLTHKMLSHTIKQIEMKELQKLLRLNSKEKE